LFRPQKIPNIFNLKKQNKTKDKTKGKLIQNDKFQKSGRRQFVTKN